MDSLDPLVEEKLIAQGNLNCIYKRTFESGRVDILKKIYNYREPYGVSGRTIREVSLLVDLKHENIISLNDVYVDRNESERPAVCMVFEAFPMSLAKFIRENAPVPEFTRWCLFEILKGVSYLHAEGVIHRDLKTDNILVDSVERVVKIADFGTARDVNVQPDSISSDVTSIHCRAIEMVYGCQNYTAAVDMWSLGCVFFELARGRPLFDNHDYFLSQRYPYDWEDGSYTGTYNVIQLYNQMVSYFGEPPLELLSPNMQSMHQMGVIGVRHGMTRDLQDEVGDLEENGRELLLMMLNIDPTARITATQALAHPSFDDIRS